MVPKVLEPQLDSNYHVVGTCWEMYSEEDYNLNCP